LSDTDEKSTSAIVPFKEWKPCSNEMLMTNMLS